MVTKEELKGHWSEVKGRLKEHWGQLTDDELTRAKGSADQLVGVVHQKTGATRREVEDFLSNIFSGAGNVSERVNEAVQHATQVAGEYAEEAGQQVRENYRRAAEVGAQYTDKVAHTVRTRPAESLAIAFGVGIAAGALLFFKGRR